MHVGLDKYAHSPNTIQLDFFVLVQPPVAHRGERFATCLVLLVTFSENGIFVKTGGQPQTLRAFYP
jgi:hypothetical protein